MARILPFSGQPTKQAAMLQQILDEPKSDEMSEKRNAFLQRGAAPPCR